MVIKLSAVCGQWRNSTPFTPCMAIGLHSIGLGWGRWLKMMKKDEMKYYGWCELYFVIFISFYFIAALEHFEWVATEEYLTEHKIELWLSYICMKNAFRWQTTAFFLVGRPEGLISNNMNELWWNQSHITLIRHIHRKLLESDPTIWV